MTFGKTLYTGMIDEYFDYRLGALEYRSLRFLPGQLLVFIEQLIIAFIIHRIVWFIPFMPCRRILPRNNRPLLAPKFKINVCPAQRHGRQAIEEG